MTSDRYSILGEYYVNYVYNATNIVLQPAPVVKNTKIGIGPTDESICSVQIQNMAAKNIQKWCIG